VATNFLCAAYSLLTAVFVKKLIGKSWLHPLDQVRTEKKRIPIYTSMLVHAPPRSRLI